MAKRNHTKAGPSAPSKSQSTLDEPQNPAQEPPGRQVSVPAAELQETAFRLRIMRCTVMTAVIALNHQAADHDIDFAYALHHGVAGPMFDEIERLEALLREEQS